MIIRRYVLSGVSIQLSSSTLFTDTVFRVGLECIGKGTGMPRPKPHPWEVLEAKQIMEYQKAFAKKVWDPNVEYFDDIALDRSGEVSKKRRRKVVSGDEDDGDETFGRKAKTARRTNAVKKRRRVT